MKNKKGFGVVVVGVVIMVVAVIGFFVVGNLVNPPSATVYVAGQDINQGTQLADLPDTAFQAVPVGKSTVLEGSLVTKAELEAMRAAGGAFVTFVAKGDPIAKSAIASSANDAGAMNPSLSNSDPNLVVIHLLASDMVPDGIRVGDRIDLPVAVSSVRFDESYALSVANVVAQATKNGESTDQFTGSVTQEDYNNASLAGGSDLLNDQDMLAYYFEAPLAKTIVQNAKVINVIRETNTNTYVDSSTGQTMENQSYGAVIALDILVPRDSVEWISMSQAAGQLTISLLSPMAGDESVPTLGVSMQDLIDEFYASRGLSVKDTITNP